MMTEPTLPSIPIRVEASDDRIVLVAEDGTRLPALSPEQTCVLLNEVLAALQAADTPCFTAWVGAFYRTMSQVLAALERLPDDGRAH